MANLTKRLLNKSKKQIMSIINARAAITDGKGNFTIETIQVGTPGPNEVLVEIKAAGICHTDWDSLNWVDRFTWSDHMILGHEGAGSYRGRWRRS